MEWLLQVTKVEWLFVAGDQGGVVVCRRLTKVEWLFVAGDQGEVNVVCRRLPRWSGCLSQVTKVEWLLFVAGDQGGVVVVCRR